jgi:hypothetical protein
MSNSDAERERSLRQPQPAGSSMAEKHQLVIRRPNPDLSIELYDAYDTLLAGPRRWIQRDLEGIIDTSDVEQIELNLPRGLYVVRGMLGDQRQEMMIKLTSRTKIDAPVPVLKTAAAYQSADSSHEYYSYTAAEHSRRATTNRFADCGAADASLYLFFRASDRKTYATSARTFEQASQRWFLQSPDGIWLSLSEHAQFHADGWLALHAPARAGSYVLHDLDDPRRSTHLELFPQWQTQLFMNFERQLRYDTLRIFLSPMARGFEADDAWARAVDLGLSVLLRGQGAIPADARRLLLERKFENPMLGIVVAWLLLQEPTVPRDLMEDVLVNLDRLIPHAADVDALRAVYASRFQPGDLKLEPIRGVPMLLQAARELIRLSTMQVGLLSPDNPLHRINGRFYADSAFTTWQPMDEERLNLPADLLGQTFGPATTSIFSFSLHQTLAGLNPLSTNLKGTIPLLPGGDFEDVADLQGGDERTRDGSFEAGASIPLADPEMALRQYDANRMSIDALADVVEQFARWNERQGQAKPIQLSDLALRAGLTPQAAEQALQAVPLSKVTIGLSVSDNPASEQLQEDSPQQVKETTGYLARTLLSAGASLAYGGDFRSEGFTRLLAEMIRVYNQTESRQAQLLDCYLAAHVSLRDLPAGLPIRIRHLLHTAELAGRVILPPPSPDLPIPSALYFCDMRRVMTEQISARVILGGQTQPKLQEGSPGYGGRYPGVVEEAWWTLSMSRPLYVLGGFGGAAGLVADLLEFRETPAPLLEQTLFSSAYYQQTAARIDASDYRQKLGLPIRPDDLAEAIRQAAKPLLTTDEAALRWNGLTMAENRQLFRTRDLEMITGLILKGLFIRFARTG